MRLVTYKFGERERVGVWIKDDAYIVDLKHACVVLGIAIDKIFDSMLDLTNSGERGLEIARKIVSDPPEEAIAKTNECKICAPLPQPSQMRDFLAFEQHLLNGFEASKTILANLADDPEAEMLRIEEAGIFRVPEIWYEKPVYYLTNRFSVRGHDDEIHWPAYSQLMDFELEIAAVIGKAGQNISSEDAHDHIFGFTIFNDFSARDEQMLVWEAKLGPGKGKEFEGGNVLGPCIVTLDEIGDFDNLTMKARVNGQQWSEGNTATMYHKFPDMIEYASQNQIIHPGEIFGSGTVGSGCGAEQSKFLESGDVVELEIEKIGVLRNRVILDQGSE